LGAGVSHITLLDQSELQLYLLQDELKTRLAQIPHHCLIGSVTDQAFVADVLQEECPQVIFHAAAYKHVHLMEENPRAALITNVQGTALLGKEALKAGVEHFVLISSDKAVHPTSVMGATKRLAEQVCLGLNSQERTMFHVVRFGNVIGSSGSVVPLFERQLAAGGPLTVTHPEVTRFFMTIPEAVRLILQTVIMGRGGEIFLLEMGEPVKILDLAEQMILLAGREPHTEIPIQFVGLRPGEKLHEELWHANEQRDQTAHQKILKVASSDKMEEPTILLAQVEALLSLPTSSLGSAIVSLANEPVPSGGELSPSPQYPPCSSSS
jgi:FlaA1/EpsC-like NDP-sugar epimerase